MKLKGLTIATFIFILLFLMACSSAPAPETMAKCIMHGRAGMQKGLLSEIGSGKLTGSEMNDQMEKSVKEAGCSVGEYKAGLKKINSNPEYKMAVEKEMFNVGLEMFKSK